MIPIFKPFMPPGIDKELVKILYSEQLSYGKYGKIFEEQLGIFVGNEKILTTSTYNQAMLIAISVLGLKPGDEVIASPVSCLASNQPFVIKGVTVKWIDVDPRTSAMDVEKLRKLITTKTKAIFNNVFCGFAGELDTVYAIGQEFGLPVVDDCIEGFGTRYKGKYMGNTGADITVFSFQTVRLPNTIDGGALSFKDQSLYEKAKLTRDYGIDRRNFRNADGEINPACDITIEGYGATMSEVNSYIGVSQMQTLPHLLKMQHENAKHWDRFFDKNSEVRPLATSANCDPNYWVYGLLAENKSSFVEAIKAEGYYATGVHINNNIYSVFKNMVVLPGVNEFMKKFVAIPSGWWVKNNLK